MPILAQKFYLIKNGIIAPKSDFSGPVLAGSTLRKSQFNVVKVIRGIQDYSDLRNNMNRVGHIRDSGFLKLWRSMSSPSREDAQQWS